MVGTGLSPLTPGTIPGVRFRSAEAACLRTAPRASWPDSSPQWRYGTVHAARPRAHLGARGSRVGAIRHAQLQPACGFPPLQHRLPTSVGRRPIQRGSHPPLYLHRGFHSVASSCASRRCPGRFPVLMCRVTGPPSFFPFPGSGGPGHAPIRDPGCGSRVFWSSRHPRPGFPDNGGATVAQDCVGGGRRGARSRKPVRPGGEPRPRFHPHTGAALIALHRGPRRQSGLRATLTGGSGASMATVT